MRTIGYIILVVTFVSCSGNGEGENSCITALDCDQGQICVNSVCVDDTGDTSDTSDSGNTGNTGNTTDTGDSVDTGDTSDTSDSGNTGNTTDSDDSGNTGNTGLDDISSDNDVLIDEDEDIAEDDDIVYICGNSIPESGEDCDDGKNGNDKDGCYDNCKSGNRPKGNFDGALKSLIWGWSCDSDDQNQAVEIYINFHDGNDAFNRQVSGIISNIDRLDAAAECGGTSLHGFQYDPSAVISAMETESVVKPYRAHVYARNNIGGWPEASYEFTYLGGGIIKYCGNSVIDEGEGCEDGNAVDNDSCTNSCKVNNCLVSGWTYYNDHCYKKFSSSTYWSSAQSQCRWSGGDLATVNDASENEFIRSMISSNTWIGANDGSAEGSWTWSSSEAWSYSNWNGGEPNNDDNEDCGEMYTSGTWNDKKCGNWLNYMCERPNNARCEYRIRMEDSNYDGWCMYYDSEYGSCYQNHDITVSLNGSQYGIFFLDYGYTANDIYLPAVENGTSLSIVFRNADTDGEWPDNGIESSYRVYNHNGAEVSYQNAASVTLTVSCP